MRGHLASTLSSTSGALMARSATHVSEQIGSAVPAAVLPRRVSDKDNLV
jgi:hypothetical protein